MSENYFECPQEVCPKCGRSYRQTLRMKSAGMCGVCMYEEYKKKENPKQKSEKKTIKDYKEMREKKEEIIDEKRSELKKKLRELEKKDFEAEEKSELRRKIESYSTIKLRAWIIALAQDKESLFHNVDMLNMITDEVLEFAEQQRLKEEKKRKERQQL